MLEHYSTLETNFTWSVVRPGDVVWVFTSKYFEDYNNRSNVSEHRVLIPGFLAKRRPNGTPVYVIGCQQRLSSSGMKTSYIQLFLPDHRRLITMRVSSA